MLPPSVRRQVEEVLAQRTAAPVAIGSADPVGGGCVSPVARLRTDAGERFFVKWTAPGHPEGRLRAEARGLEALARTRTVRVPAVVALAPDEESWLLLEWIEPGPAAPGAWGELGEGLAALHRTGGDAYGADEDNFIGPLPQANGPLDSWAEFWARRRIEPQLRRAVDDGFFESADRARFDHFLSGLDTLLAPAAEEGPSPLHGDLWSGNVHMAAAGPPAVVDPSAYRGHREVDLAMADLFGGFGPPFREAYEGGWPVQDGYEARKAAYQLYYLLVHVNLFGAGYVSGCRRALPGAGV